MDTTFLTDKTDIWIKKYFQSYRVGTTIIDGYNYFLEVFLPNIVIGSSVLGKKDRIVFTGLRYIRPFIDNKYGNPIKYQATTYGSFKKDKSNNFLSEFSVVPLYPKTARLKKEPYVLKIQVEYTYTENVLGQGKPPVTKIGDLCSFPLMLGSKECWLYSKTPEELTSLGESSADVFGYFVSENGNERFLVNVDQLRDIPLVYLNKDSIVCSITTNTNDGSKKIEISDRLKHLSTISSAKTFSGKKEESDLIMLFSFFQDKSSAPNVLLILESLFQLLNFYYPRAVSSEPWLKSLEKSMGKIDIITWLLKELNLDSTEKLFFQSTIEQFISSKGKREDSLYEYIKNSSDNSIKAFKNIQQMSSDMNLLEIIKSKITSEESDIQIIALLTSIFQVELFPGLNHDSLKPIIRPMKTEIPSKESLENKIKLLVYMIKKIITGIAHSKLESRDDWGKKRINTAGSRFEKLFRNSFSNALNNYIDDSNFRNIYLSITRDFQKSFTTYWGIHEKVNMSKYKEMISQIILERYNDIKALESILKIQRPGERMADTARVSNLTHYGFICPASTPDGKECGMTVYLSIVTKISQTIPRHNLVELVKDLYTDSITSKINHIEEKTVVTNDLIIMESTEELFSKTGLEQIPNEYLPTTKLYIDNILIGYTYPKAFKLIKNRKLRSSSIASIIYDPKQNIIIISGDYGRMIAPYMVYDSKRKKLLAQILEDEPTSSSFSNLTFNDLVKAGTIEFLDPNETVANSLIAEDPKTAIFSSKSYEEETNLGIFLDKIFRFPSIYDRNNLQEMYVALGSIQTVSSEIIVKYQKLVELVLKDITLYPNFKQRISKELANFRKGVFYLRENQFTHTYLSPSQILSISTVLAPMAHRNQAARGILQAGMLRGSLSANMEIQVEGGTIITSGNTSKSLLYPNAPLFSTIFSEIFGFSALGTGHLATVAIMASASYNQEDAIEIKQEATERGFGKSIVREIYETDSFSSTDFERINKDKAWKKKKNPEIYKGLNSKGYVDVGTPVRNGDCLFFYEYDFDGKKEIASKFVTVGDDGVITRVDLIKISKGFMMIFEISAIYSVMVGNKLAPRYAQKGSVGKITPEKKMPFTKDGIIPDIIINPLAIPSRMTMGMLIEMICGPVSAITGKIVNSTSFNTDFSLQNIINVLREYGFSASGETQLYDPSTFKPLESLVMTGPLYYQILRHMIQNKIQARGVGMINPITRQPIQGKDNTGGLRFGEMERENFIEHGVLSALNERMSACSDSCEVIVCSTCRGKYTGPSTSGARNSCRKCGNANFQKITLPYAYVTLTQIMAFVGINISLQPEHGQESLSGKIPRNIAPVRDENNVSFLMEQLFQIEK